MRKLYSNVLFFPLLMLDQVTLSVVRGITCMNNVHIILESMSEMGNKSIVLRYISDWIN
jgi:hypothetical protein